MKYLAVKRIAVALLSGACIAFGIWFVWFLSLSLATCVFFFVRNRETLKSEHRLESLVSRESSFLFNNLLFVLFCFTVLWGTLFPILSEWVEGTKVTVGPPFFNKVAIPVLPYAVPSFYPASTAAKESGT